MIRPAYSDDIEQLAGLLAELFEIEDDFVIDRKNQLRGLQLLLENPDALVLVAEINGKIIGMASLQRLISTAAGEYVGLIEDVVVTHSFRGQGIGSKLLESIFAEADARGYARLALGADLRNTKAIGFYKRFGFSASNMGLMYRS